MLNLMIPERGWQRSGYLIRSQARKNPRNIRSPGASSHVRAFLCRRPVATVSKPDPFFTERATL